MKKVALYARVSTDRQDTEAQIQKLLEYIERRGWTLYKTYQDEGYSGVSTKRPGFSEMRSDAHRRKFDVLLVWKLDRLSRSLKDLITTLEDLGSLGIDFVSFTNDIDTSTPSGKLLFHVIGAVAEFERELIRERVKAGLENARRKNKRLGRPPLSENLLAQARDLRSQGLSFYKIARQLGLTESTIRKRLNKEGPEGKSP